MTMSCEEARRRMVEADLDEVEGHEETPLRAHLRGCARCMADVARIVEMHSRLDARLITVAAEIAKQADPREARDTAGALRRPRARVFVPLAAAALATVILLSKNSETRTPFDYVPPPAWAASTNSIDDPIPLVQAISHDRVAVLPTANPDITVVWFMN